MNPLTSGEVVDRKYGGLITASIRKCPAPGIVIASQIDNQSFVHPIAPRASCKDAAGVAIPVGPSTNCATIFYAICETTTDIQPIIRAVEVERTIEFAGGAGAPGS